MILLPKFIYCFVNNLYVRLGFNSENVYILLNHLLYYITSKYFPHLFIRSPIVGHPSIIRIQCIGLLPWNVHWYKNICDFKRWIAANFFLSITLVILSFLLVMSYCLFIRFRLMVHAVDIFVSSFLLLQHPSIN